MIDFLKTIPIFFHVPKNAGTFVRSWQKTILENESEDRSLLRSIIVTNENKEQILELQVLDDNLITENKVFLKNQHYDKKALEISLCDFKLLDKKEEIKVFSASVLSFGFSVQSDLIQFIKKTWSRNVKLYIILRDPLENEWSFYNYVTTRLCQHEKKPDALKSKSFKEYLLSEEMSDSWLIHNLTKVNGDITESDFNNTVDLLDEFGIFNIKQSSKLIKTMFKDCYGINVDINHNATINKNQSKNPILKKEELGLDLIEKFKKKKKYEYKLYERYTSNANSESFFSKKPKTIKIEECFFCHNMNFGKEKLVGTWDVSRCIIDYLGNTDFKNKRVIDVGAGSGYNSFYMEQMGAKVVSHEIPNGNFWDFFKHPNSQKIDKNFNQAMLNGYWYAHEKYKSKNDLFLWDIYKDIPDEVGSFDIAVFSMVLSHFRDPFLALMNVLYKTKEKAILINTFTEQPTTTGFFYGEDGLWWELSKQCIHCFMEKVGFRLTSEKIVLPYNNDERQTKEYKCLVFERF